MENKKKGQWPVSQLLRMSRKVNDMYYHVKSRSQIKLKPSEYEWEQLVNKMDVIHDVIMNNRYNGSQKTRQQQQQQQQQQYPPKGCVCCSSFDHRSNKCQQSTVLFVSRVWTVCQWVSLEWLYIWWQISRELQPCWGNDLRTRTGHGRRTFHETSRPSNTTNKPPPKRPKKPAGKVFKPTENEWEEVFAPNVCARKVKYSQAKLKLNWSKDTVTQDIAVRHSQVSKKFMFCCYNVMMSYGFNKNVDNLKRTFIIILSGPKKGRWGVEHRIYNPVRRSSSNSRVRSVSRAVFLHLFGHVPNCSPSSVNAEYYFFSAIQFPAERKTAATLSVAFLLRSAPVLKPFSVPWWNQK